MFLEEEKKKKREEEEEKEEGKRKVTLRVPLRCSRFFAAVTINYTRVSND